MDRYELAFLKGDRAEMAELAAALKGVPGLEDPLFSMPGDTEDIPIYKQAKAEYAKLESPESPRVLVSHDCASCALDHEHLGGRKCH